MERIANTINTAGQAFRKSQVQGLMVQAPKISLTNTWNGVLHDYRSYHNWIVKLRSFILDNPNYEHLPEEQKRILILDSIVKNSSAFNHIKTDILLHKPVLGILKKLEEKYSNPEQLQRFYLDQLMKARSNQKEPPKNFLKDFAWLLKSM